MRHRVAKGRVRERTPPAGIALRLLLLGAAVSTGLAIPGCEPEPTHPGVLDRGKVHVSIAESLDGVPTDRNIAELLTTRALLQHGFHLAPEDEARYLVEGALVGTFHQVLKMKLGDTEQLLEHQWNADYSLTITDREAGAGEGTETFSFPEPLMNGRTDPELARRDIRRRAATMMIHDLMNGSTFGDPEVARLLNAFQDPYDPRLFNEIESQIIDIGVRAVPYLLTALTDTRPVRPIGEYPDLGEFNLEELKVHHLADRMLSEILGRAPGLDLLATEERRLRVITGWTWAWEEVQEIPVEYRVDPEGRLRSVPDTPR